jgi:hypothetical protein
LNAGLKISLRIGFESWSHEEQIGLPARVSGEKQQNVNRSRRQKSWSLKRICESTSRFATQAGAVLTSPYPSVDFLTRGFVRLR